MDGWVGGWGPTTCFLDRRLALPSGGVQYASGWTVSDSPGMTSGLAQRGGIVSNAQCFTDRGYDYFGGDIIIDSEC